MNTPATKKEATPRLVLDGGVTINNSTSTDLCKLLHVHSKPKNIMCVKWYTSRMFSLIQTEQGIIMLLLYMQYSLNVMSHLHTEVAI